MSQRLTKNSWEGGKNTDTDKSKLDPIFYTEAHNVESVSDGNFYSLKNIRGTTNVQDIINTPNTEVLGVFPNSYLIDGASKKCLTIFTATTSGNFNVWCLDVESATLYQIYQEAIEDDYLTPDRVIDAVGYAENNVDHIYFTDDYNSLRFIRCEIPSSYSANFLNTAEITTQRLGANGKVALDSILSGGSLLSGTYQFAYRMVDPINKRFTKWSSLTSPIHIYSADNSNASVYSDYGLPSNFKIRLDITPSTTELNSFDYFQLAVVENVYPTGPEVIVDGDNQTFVASLLPIVANTDYLSSGVLENYEFKTNAKVGLVPIEEIVVDLAAIKHFKTLNVKQKRLIIGNITYHNLEFDNGDPAASGSIATTIDLTNNDLFSSHSNSSTVVGYFRDEVYRYGIVYKDNEGNRSPVKVLDLNSITNNQISGGIPDVRFPSRSTSNAWTMFNSSGRLQSLGLNLTNIRNHPTWATGFEIVRAKRKKKIISQTPLIPMMSVEGVGALDNYPVEAITTTSGDVAEYPNAQPQSSVKNYVPKNLFWPEARRIARFNGIQGVGTNQLKNGEAIIRRNSASIPTAMLFPQNYMYGNNPLVLSGAEKIEVIDYVALRVVRDENSSGTAGDNINTQIKGTFYALDEGDYYFDPAWVAKSISETPMKISAYETFENLSESKSLGGKKIMDYTSLETEGVSFGFRPNIQKSIVAEIPLPTTNDSHEVLGVKVLTFANAGTSAAVASGVAMFSGNALLKYENSNTISNKYVNEYIGFVNASAYVQALKIVNIVNNYGDDRYGDVDTQHEFISTGASYTFSTSELVDVAAGNLVNVNLTVYGGDCFVSPHTFKISDGTYSVVNQSKAHTPPAPDSTINLIDKWEKYFTNNAGAAICMPVGVDSVAQFVTVVLESEYNGAVMAQDILTDSGTVVNGMPVVTPSGSTEAFKSPLTYRYNINLSKENDEKIYFVRPEFNFEKSDFPSRIAYSDQKVYNTDEVGFDVFRVLNFLDLEEKNGAITKLALEHDNLYAVQEKGIVGLPVGETQITTTDAGQLAVGTSDFFGRPIVIDEKRGGQHIRTIVETGNGIYIPDHAKKAVYLLVDNQLINISDINNASLFRDKFSVTTTERNLIGVYDDLRKEYWIVGPDYAERFNETKKQWVGNYEFPVSTFKGSAFTNKQPYLIGKVSNQISAYSMYTGDANTLFGTVVTPRVTFVVNPDDAITKLFTNQAFISTERLSTVDYTVERELELNDQIVSGTVIAIPSKGGNYRIQTPRAANNEKLRGLRMITTVKWKTDGTYASLSDVFTKYRLESRVPF